jgi:plasmid maintenance system killer protein
MIQSFKCKETAKVFDEGFSRKFPATILKSAIIKLAMLFCWFDNTASDVEIVDYH